MWYLKISTWDPEILWELATSSFQGMATQAIVKMQAISYYITIVVISYN